MSDTGAAAGEPPEIDLPALARDLARDWATLVSSELAAMAGDREAIETWQGLLAIWAKASAASTAAAPWAAPFAAASGTGAGALERIAGQLDAVLGRLDAVERRLADLESAAGRLGGDAATE